MMRYVAFLRGINSGRNPVIKMADLRAAFEAMGLDGVRTVLATGNVLFDADEHDQPSLARNLEQHLSSELRFRVPVILRTVSDLQRLAAARPFAHVGSGPALVPHVTFLSEEPDTPLRFPVHDPERGYTLLGIIDRTVCSVVDLTAGTTPDLMRVLDREFGTNITTRNWRTIERILRSSG